MKKRCDSIKVEIKWRIEKKIREESLAQKEKERIKQGKEYKKSKNRAYGELKEVKIRASLWRRVSIRREVVLRVSVE